MSAPGSTNLLQKRMMGIKESPYGVCFQCGKVIHLVKTVLALTADYRLSKLDKQDTKEGDWYTLSRQGRTNIQNE